MLAPLNSLTAVLAGVIVLLAACGADAPPAKSDAVTTSAPAKKHINDQNAAKKSWTVLFDGKSLDGWKASDFPGKGAVRVENGAIVLGQGNDMTGIHIDRKIPRVNYVVELEAMRADGSDFFCGLTFPAKESYCSLIVGGWGGGVVGLSSLNGMDASENETSTYREFEKGKWYPIRLRVTDQRITAWIEGKEEVDVDIRDQELDTRIEVEWSKPFGIACWQTKAALRNIRIRELSSNEVKAIHADLSKN